MDRRVCVPLIILIFTIASTDCLIRRKRIVGGTEAAQPIEDNPVVYINKNDREARLYGTRGKDKIYSFRGIRYGEPPVGRSRFQRSAATYLEGEYNATKWAPPCPQPSREEPGNIIGSEDCLFLNVFTPQLPDGTSDGYPVLIWIHGGGFRRGAACQYEVRNLLRKKMIVVSIQYRLGSLGFLSTGTKDLPGNNGMFDMVLAVEWIKNHIEFFGGNPNKIIAFGHGTGAGSAMILALSKFCESTFKGIVAMSGSMLSHFVVDKSPVNTAKEVASRNGCPTHDVREMVRCLQETDINNLIKIDSEIESMQMMAQGFISGISNLLGAGPVIEGEDDERSLPNLITDTPENFLKLGNFPAIPLLAGVVKDETGGAILGGYRDEVETKLKTTPNFLSGYLVPNLQSTIPNFGNRTKFMPQSFDKFTNFFGNLQSGSNIEKVAEAMGDSLFNVPAFLTVEHWSKKAKAFLYSFEHNGKHNYAKTFLQGLPIVDAKDLANGIATHGDDLGYIFYPNTLTGEEIPNMGQGSSEDDRVTDIFTQMIADFARNGTINIITQSRNDGQLPSVIPTFSTDNSFVSITSTPKIMKNFRYCEVGLWAGLTQHLQSPLCSSVFDATYQTADQVNERTKETVGRIGGSLGKVGSIFPGK